MKARLTLFLVTAALIASAAEAADVPLDIPAVQTYSLSACPRYNVDDIVVTGFSADGSQLLAAVRGWVACGHSGRGSNLVYNYWCGTMSWDLSGSLTSVKVVSNRTYGTFLSCPQHDPTATYTNAGGYVGYSVIQYGYYGINAVTPALQSP